MTEETTMSLQAATIVCLRKGHKSMQVLLGQNEVKNWMKSTSEQLELMRYPGEWKFPGGTVEKRDISFKHTALRELQEEFIGIRIQEHEVKVALLNQTQTIAIQGRSYLMHNYVALQPDNATWLEDGIEDLINKNLESRRCEFQKLLQSNSFYSLSNAEKETKSPEVYRVAWIPIDEAIRMMAGALEHPDISVDEWQKQQFELYGRKRRDPMYKSMTVLQEIQRLGTFDNIRVATSQAELKNKNGESILHPQ